MKKTRFGMRLLVAVLCTVVAVAGFATTNPVKAAMEADTIYLSWPYEPPPTSNLNPFSSTPLVNNGFGPFSFLLTPTFAYYIWEEQKWEGWLVDKWGYTADNSAYQITLKSGLTWSDGSALTSKDVVDTFTNGLVTNLGPYSFGVNRVEAVDDLVVNFVLNEGATPSLILERLILKEAVYASSTFGQFATKIKALVDEGTAAGTALADIKKSEAWTAAAAELTGFKPDTFLSSGPYTLALADYGDAQLTLRRSDQTMFGKMAKFNKIIVYRGDTEVTTPLLLNGELNYSTDFYPPATEKTLIEKGVKILRAPSYGGPGLYFNFANPQLAKRELRQAIAHAIDRSRVTKVAYDQIGKAPQTLTGISDDAAATWVKPDVYSGLSKYEYDLDGATKILTDAGYTKDGDVWKDPEGNELAFELTAPSDFTDWLPAAQDITDQLNEFGIRVTLRAIPNAQHVPEVKAGTFQLALRLWGFPNPFPFYAYRNMYQRNGVGKVAADLGMSYPTQQNISGTDYDFDALVANMQAGTDTAPQIDAVTQAATAFNADLPIIPMVERFYNCPLIDTNIAGMPPEGDPLYGNVSGSDNIMVVLLMTGRITPK